MKNTLIVCLILVGFVANAQYIDMQLGWALPSGSFGNNNISRAEDGFAKTGSTAGVQLSYLVYKNIGVVAKANYSSFGVDATSYQNQLNAPNSSGTTVTAISNHNYTSSSAMLGGYVSLGKKNFTVDIRLMTGLVSLTNYGFTYTTNYQGQSYSQKESSESSFATAFGWGTTVKYKLPKNLFVTVNIDDIYADTHFSTTGYHSSNNETISKPFEAYLITLGIGYAIQ